MTPALFRQPELRLDQKEICRYLGLRGQPDAALSEQIERAARTVESGSFRVSWMTAPARIAGADVTLGPLPTLSSAALARCLRGCEQAVLFCATLGAAFDRALLAKRLRPSEAVVLDAAGTAGIEQLCDDFCRTLPQPQRPRFSPGYGDLPLQTQLPLLELLDARRLLGVGLTDSLLMTPCKSVTAIVGLG